jgi:predicted TPR repeat methyltransferase
MNQPANPLLLRAIDAHKGGRLAEAEAGYQRVLRKRPGDADALNFLGMLRVQSGDIAQGTQYLRRSVQSVPGNPHAWVNLGNALMAGGEIESAAEAFTKATTLAPEFAQAWYNLGVCLRRLKRTAEALQALGKAVDLGPGYGAAYEALGRLLYHAGRNAEAAEVYRKWLQAEPDNAVARHMLAAHSGENVPERAEDAYVAGMFDEFASTFDENLEELGYRAPQLLAAAVQGRIAANGSSDVLDAGCGTGLCGPLLRPMARQLVGVDISAGMTQKARARGCYDELHVQELSAFMRSRPSSFDLILSADTLVYFGALHEPFEAAHACLRSGGLLAFTVERLEAEAAVPYRIEPHGRYAHTEAYVREALARAGFALLELRSETLRRERGQQVTGHLVLAAR